MTTLRKAVVLTVLAIMLVISTSCSSQQPVGNMQDTPENTAVTSSAAVLSGLDTDADSQSAGKDNINPIKLELYPAQDNYLDGGKWGYIDNTGKFAIAPQFSQAERFQDNGLAVVGKDDKYGLVGRSGKFVAEPVYDYITDYREGLAIASVSGGSVVLDETGRKVSDKYSFIGSYSNKRAIYQTQTKEGTYIYGYLGETGKPIIAAAYQNATDFEGNRATVMLSEQQYAIIDPMGNIIKTLNYTYVGRISDGMIEFRPIGNDQYGYLDNDGNVVIQPAFSYAGNFEGGKAAASITDASGNNLYGLIDKTGKFVIQPKYDDVRQLGDNMAAVGTSVDPEFPPSGARYALADRNGRLLTDFIYYDILQPFKNGIASVNDGKELYFIDTAGKRVDTLPSAKGSGTLEKTGGLIYVNADQRSYYMNKKGEAVYKPASSVVLDGGVTISEIKFKPNRDYVVYYPVLSGMADPKAEEALNKLLASETENPSAVAMNPEDTTNTAIKPEDNLNYTYGGSFTIGLHQKDLLTLQKTGYLYPKGAAHGMPGREYLHIDLKSGTEYQLEDLFKSGNDYTKVLSGIVGKQMKDLMASDPENNLYLTEDYKGIQKDQPFYITEDSLVLYFTPYEIAPYAAGFPEFSVKFGEISDILNKDGAFWRSFN